MESASKAGRVVLGGIGWRVSGGFEVEGVERGQESRDEHLAGSS